MELSRAQNNNTRRGRRSGGCRFGWSAFWEEEADLFAFAGEEVGAGRILVASSKRAKLSGNDTRPGRRSGGCVKVVSLSGGRS
ncbi:protein of unknown function [Aminobacter niigataensis]|nr:protein of unknown function [Aminobacter niigataensis]